MSKKIDTAAVLAAVLTLAACGGGGSSPAAPTAAAPAPAPAPVTTVLHQSSYRIAAEDGGYIDVAIPRTGTIAATVDWTFASSPVWVALTPDTCGDPVSAFFDSCSNIAPSSLFERNKPKTLRGPVTQGTRARLWVLNLADVDESIAVQVTLTSAVASLALDHGSAGVSGWVRFKKPASLGR
jgi:hypothetical protein